MDVKLSDVYTFKVAEEPIVKLEEKFVVKVPTFTVPFNVLLPLPVIVMFPEDASTVPEFEMLAPLKVRVLPEGIVKVAAEGIIKVAPVNAQSKEPIENEVEFDELERVKVSVELKELGLIPLPSALSVQLVKVVKLLVEADFG
jgi:hypothetical protein